MRYLIPILLFVATHAEAQWSWVIRNGNLFVKNGNDSTIITEYSPFANAQWGSVWGTLSTQTDLQNAFNAKQAALVSGTSIKTVNGNTLLGSGDISISSAVAWGGVTGTLSNQTDLNNALGLKAPLASPTFTGTVILPNSTITNAMLAGSIAYSKLTLTGAILNADLAGAIASSKLVGSDITTVGTIGTGTWNATAIADGKIATALTGKTYNGLTLTATTGTFTLTNAKTLSVSNTLTFAGTDGSTLNVGTGGTLGTNAFLSTAFAPVNNATFTGTFVAPNATITNAMLAGSIDLATKVTGILPFASNAGATAATSATTGTMTVNMTTTIITITPSGACTFNGSGGVTGQRATFFITTSGASSFNLTWGTNFRTTGVLATGVTTARLFCVSFLCTNGTQWVETARTAAIP